MVQTFNPFSLEGKQLLVTGASAGIGQAIAIACSKMGASVIITGRNVERLNVTRSLLMGEGHLSIAGDLTNEIDILKIMMVVGACIFLIAAAQALPMFFGIGAYAFPWKG